MWSWLACTWLDHPFGLLWKCVKICLSPVIKPSPASSSFPDLSKVIRVAKTSAICLHTLWWSLYGPTDLFRLSSQKQSLICSSLIAGCSSTLPLDTEAQKTSLKTEAKAALYVSAVTKSPTPFKNWSTLSLLSLTTNASVASLVHLNLPCRSHATQLWLF